MKSYILTKNEWGNREGRKTKKTGVCLTAAILISFIGLAYAADWEVITTFTGESDQITNDFNVPTHEWRIAWIITPDPENQENAVFYAFVHLKGESSWYTESIATDAEQTNGILNLHDGAKDYYLEIKTANLESYTLRVEYDKTTSTPTMTPGDTSTPSYFTTLVIAAILIIIGVGSLMAVMYIRRKRKQAR